jgi:16S rRNA (cytidine1402-2'-O)-methyltransferase
MTYGTLYIVSTPIGNLADISQRAVEVLKSVDLIASEDTRVTGRLLSRLGIKTRQTSYHDHNERKKAPVIMDLIENGGSAALVSDAGTPLISDPGYTLVKLAIEHGITIISVPGPSSVLAALVLSGFPSDRFCFEGYPPRTEGKLRRFFRDLTGERRTIIFMETPHRIKKCLKIMLEELGDREIFIGRELTKKFEEKLRGSVTQIMELLAGRSVKGEITVVVKADSSK